MPIGVPSLRSGTPRIVRKVAELCELTEGVFWIIKNVGRLVYVILAENGLILPEAQAPQPDHNVHESAPSVTADILLEVARKVHSSPRRHP